MATIAAYQKSFHENRHGKVARQWHHQRLFCRGGYRGKRHHDTRSVGSYIYPNSHAEPHRLVLCQTYLTLMKSSKDTKPRQTPGRHCHWSPFQAAGYSMTPHWNVCMFLQVRHASRSKSPRKVSAFGVPFLPFNKKDPSYLLDLRKQSKKKEDRKTIAGNLKIGTGLHWPMSPVVL